MGFTALQILLWDDGENLDLDAEFLEDPYACWSGLKANDCLHMWTHYRQPTQLHTLGYRLRIVKEHIAFNASLFALERAVKHFAIVAPSLL